MRDFKSHVRQEWAPKPIKRQASGFAAFLIIGIAIYLAVEFGIVAAGAFFALALAVSVFTGRKYNF